MSHKHTGWIVCLIRDCNFKWTNKLSKNKKSCYTIFHKLSWNIKTALLMSKIHCNNWFFSSDQTLFYWKCESYSRIFGRENSFQISFLQKHLQTWRRSPKKDAHQRTGNEWVVQKWRHTIFDIILTPFPPPIVKFLSTSVLSSQNPWYTLLH